MNRFIEYFKFWVTVIMIATVAMYITGAIKWTEFFLSTGHWASCVWWRCHPYCSVKYEFTEFEQLMMLELIVINVGVIMILTTLFIFWLTDKIVLFFKAVGYDITELYHGYRKQR